LYDVDSDPLESKNIIKRYPEIAEEMRAYMKRVFTIPVDDIERRAKQLHENVKILKQCDFDDEKERWHAPECARDYPKDMVTSKVYREYVQKKQEVSK
ncbi:MAG: hypothetical protein J6I64_09440, partial [Lachnospiraceae bacterium]|nr:hypothetical protein [Lachnospiraceae bacterium]